MLHERFNLYRTLSVEASLLRYGASFRGYKHTEEELYTAHLVMDKIADYYFYRMGTNNH